MTISDPENNKLPRQERSKFAFRTDLPIEEGELPCAAKMAFDSKEEAEAVGLAAEWQHGGTLKVYRCRHCHLWHLSSNT
jgi:hypothetical protein